jgi:biotin carboxylase/SAM-dependent methyltransferase
MKEQIILVVPPFTYRTEAYLSAAKKMGLEAICALDPNYGAPEAVESYFPIAMDDQVGSAYALVGYAQANQVKAVVSIDDGGGEIAALTSEALGFAHNPLQAINAANNKHCMRVLLDRANVPSPRYSLHRICENPCLISQSLQYPVVVKPLFLTGSRGVIRANDPREFIAAFRRVGELLLQPGTGPDPKSLLIEEYIPGVEVSLEGVLADGKLLVLGLYDKPDPLEGPYFEETIFITPSRLPAGVQERIMRCGELALDAVGLRVGPVQVELRVNEKGPRIVELAARTMGGHCSRALPFKGKLTFEELVLSQALGLDTVQFITESGAHGVMMIPIPGEGIYRAVHGVEKAEAVPGISGVMITIPADSIVTPLPEGDNYVGFIFANGDSPDIVERALREAHSRLHFELDSVTRIKLRIRPQRPLVNDNRDLIRAEFGAVAEEHLSPFHAGFDTGRAWELYDRSDVLGLPHGATASALGCGNPSRKANLQPGETVLDLGSGGGIDCLIAARAVGETGRVIGIDMTDGMVLLARQNQISVGLANVEFLKGEIDDLPLPDAGVDVVISNNTINLTADKDAVFREMLRVLRPGGRFVLCDVAVEQGLSESCRANLFMLGGCLNEALGRLEYPSRLRRAGFVDTEIISQESCGFLSGGLYRITIVGRKPEMAAEHQDLPTGL